MDHSTLHSDFLKDFSHIISYCFLIDSDTRPHSSRAFNIDRSNRNEENLSIKTLEDCAVKIRQWMDVNRLKMNDSKTEFILFGGSHQLKKCTTSINVNGTDVECSGVVKYLGAYLDSSLNMMTHIGNKCRTAMCNIQRIRYIRKSLTREACVVLMLGLVISHLDFANALFACLPDVALNQLQRIQNIAAKIVLNKRKLDSATACLRELHWLPVRFRIRFKILTLVYRCVHGDARSEGDISIVKRL